jgi:hypothetical protein
MSIASITAAPAKATAIDVSLHVDEAISGKPVGVDQASAHATTRFALDAPAGAQIRVQVPTGAGMNGWAWGNEGKAGVSFAKEGADWVTTAKVPLTQLSLQTFAFQHQGDAIRSDGSTVEVDDLAPKVSVDGVAQAADAPAVTVSAPLGWQTSAKNGAADVLHEAAGATDTVAGDRDAGLGAATIARFTGRAPDGHDTVGPVRVLHETKERVTDAAAGAIYTALALTGLAG